ncbi:MAG: hypothetical protein ACQSGP_09860 [Frankia sp.]
MPHGGGALSGFEVGFVDVDGERRLQPLTSCRGVPFERMPPAWLFDKAGTAGAPLEGRRPFHAGRSASYW